MLSDANTDFDCQALGNLTRWFADPRVNAVCGRLILKAPAGGKNVDSLYWRYENFLKACEGRLGGLLGANGGIYAIRRSVCVPIPDNTILDDLVIPLLGKLRHGGRIVYDPQALAWEETPATIGSEFLRRVRIGTGAYQALTLLWGLLSPRHGWTAFAFLSHKVLRWAAPLLLLAMIPLNLLLLEQRLYQWVLIAQLAFYAIAIAGMYAPGRGVLSRLVRVVTMFASMNMALLCGFLRWATTQPTGTWQRTTRSD